MTKYKPNYEDVNVVSNGMTPTGLTSRQCVTIEEGAQKRIAENEKWLLARDSLETGKGYVDSKEGLEKRGFKVVREHDDLFYEVIPPREWTKSTEGYWTDIMNDKGKIVITQFFKGAFYDRNAHLNFADSEN